MKKLLPVIIVVVLMCLLISMCGGNGGHAPGYGNTSKCTICGKAATHKSTNYGFCDKHWRDAMNYGK